MSHDEEVLQNCRLPLSNPPNSEGMIWGYLSTFDFTNHLALLLSIGQSFTIVILVKYDKADIQSKLDLSQLTEVFSD